MSGRIGLLVPSSNTVMEVDFYRRLPPGTTLHTARMRLEATTPEGEAEMLDNHLPGAASTLATARPDVVVFGCTSAAVLRGNEDEAGLVRRLASDTGAPAVSVAASARAALRAYGARRVGVITPYADSLNRPLRESLEAGGLTVVAVRGLGITDNFTIAEVEPERIVDLAVASFRAVDIDALFVSCTNLRALEARGRIEAALRRPVVTSNQAALEATLQRLSARQPAATA